MYWTLAISTLLSLAAAAWFSWKWQAERARAEKLEWLLAFERGERKLKKLLESEK